MQTRVEGESRDESFKWLVKLSNFMDYSNFENILKIFNKSKLKFMKINRIGIRYADSITLMISLVFSYKQKHKNPKISHSIFSTSGKIFHNISQVIAWRTTGIQIRYAENLKI